MERQAHYATAAVSEEVRSAPGATPSSRQRQDSLAARTAPQRDRLLRLVCTVQSGATESTGALSTVSPEKMQDDVAHLPAFYARYMICAHWNTNKECPLFSMTENHRKGNTEHDNHDAKEASGRNGENGEG